MKPLTMTLLTFSILTSPLSFAEYDALKLAVPGGQYVAAFGMGQQIIDAGCTLSQSPNAKKDAINEVISQFDKSMHKPLIANFSSATYENKEKLVRAKIDNAFKKYRKENMSDQEICEFITEKYRSTLETATTNWNQAKESYAYQN